MREEFLFQRSEEKAAPPPQQVRQEKGSLKGKWPLTSNLTILGKRDSNDCSGDIISPVTSSAIILSNTNSRVRTIIVFFFIYLIKQRSALKQALNLITRIVDTEADHQLLSAIFKHNQYYRLCGIFFYLSTPYIT